MLEHMIEIILKEQKSSQPRLQNMVPKSPNSTPTYKINVKTRCANVQYRVHSVTDGRFVGNCKGTECLVGVTAVRVQTAVLPLLGYNSGSLSVVE